MIKNIIVDKRAGFCSGVKRAVNLVEKEFKKKHKVYALGDLIHNRKELKRLEKGGLKIIDQELLKNKGEKILKGKKVIIRAHGEKKEIFDFARKHKI
ncbi:4-hydroxy-3-methylbut-2-enyl diphosphate reductase, partial [candidate division KSB1 bacterium]